MKSISAPGQNSCNFLANGLRRENEAKRSERDCQRSYLPHTSAVRNRPVTKRGREMRGKTLRHLGRGRTWVGLLGCISYNEARAEHRGGRKERMCTKNNWERACFNSALYDELMENDQRIRDCR